MCAWQSGLFELRVASHLRLMIRAPDHSMISMGLPMTVRLHGKVDEVLARLMRFSCVCMAGLFELRVASHLRLMMIRAPNHSMISMGLPMTVQLHGKVDEVLARLMRFSRVCMAVRFV